MYHAYVIQDDFHTSVYCLLSIFLLYFHSHISCCFWTIFWHIHHSNIHKSFDLVWALAFQVLATEVFTSVLFPLLHRTACKITYRVFLSKIHNLTFRRETKLRDIFYKKWLVNIGSMRHKNRLKELQSYRDKFSQQTNNIYKV